MNPDLLVYAFSLGLWVAPIIGLGLWLRHSWKEWQEWNNR